MDWQILFVLGVLGLILIAFVKEWFSPDLVAMGGFCILLISGVLKAEDAFSVFSNHAPITIAGMFILSAALEKTGTIDSIGRFIAFHLKKKIRFILLGSMALVALCSAFVNNTPVVAVFIPVMMGLARSNGIAPSKLLIPLSYASIMGGCCTVIGTSTNLLVSGLIEDSFQLAPIGIFEITQIALPLLVIGLIYIVCFGPLFLPERQSITSLLESEERKNYLCHVLVKEDSPLVGRRLVDTPLAEKKSQFLILEVRRNGARLKQSISKVVVKPFDRLLLSAPIQQMVSLPKVEGVTLATETQGELGIQNLSTIEGSIVEGIISPNSRLIGRTIRSLNFRQSYGMLILAIHRHGKNLSSNFVDEKLEFGDTVLMLGPLNTFTQLREQGDFMLLEDKMPLASRKEKAPIVWTVVGATILATAFGVFPIVTATTVACFLVLVTRCIDADDAYKAVEWRIIFMIYGMLGLGMAMHETHAAQYVANLLLSVTERAVSPEYLPIVTLSLIYLLTNIITEMISNNATAVIMVPIAVSSAQALEVHPRPFIIAVMVAASASFLTPIGYQTNTMIYGAGGYRFTDFIRFGFPLTITFWIVSTWLIPRIWPF